MCELQIRFVIRVGDHSLGSSDYLWLALILSNYAAVFGDHRGILSTNVIHQGAFFPTHGATLILRGIGECQYH